MTAAANNTALGQPVHGSESAPGSIPRNHNGWPKVPNPADPSKTLLCHRPSALAKKYLSETFTLDKWTKRTIIKGAGLRPDLGEMAASLDLTDDRDRLQELAHEAAVAGGRESGANRGTATHQLTERHLRGDASVDVPPGLQPTFDAIRRCLDDHGIAARDGWVERFVVNPRVPAAGTLDAGVTVPGLDGLIVLDQKDGQHDPRKYSGLEYACQTAIYAHSTHTWGGLGTELQPVPEDLNRHVGLILWAPAGGDHAELLPVDLTEGWAMAMLACQVRDGRRNAKRFWAVDVELTSISQSVQTAIDEHARTGDDDALDAALAELTPPKPEPEPQPARKVGALPQLQEDCQLLRRRLAYLTAVELTTTDDIIERWPVGAPKLTDPTAHTEETIDAIGEMVADLELELGVHYADPETLSAAVELQARLAPDLEKRFNEAMRKVTETRSPTMPYGKRLQWQIAAVLPTLKELVAELEERVSKILTAFAEAELDDRMRTAAIKLAREAPIEGDLKPGRKPEPPSLTALEAERVIALALHRKADLAGLGSASQILTVGRAMAKGHHLEPPKSSADVAASPVLAALTAGALIDVPPAQ